MNRKQLILVIGLGALLALLAVSVLKKQSSTYTASSPEGTKLLPDFDINSVAALTIKSGANAVDLAKKDDVWVVKQRNDYPANFDSISEVVKKFWELKVARPLKIGPSRLPMLELAGPDKGSTLLEMKDASGKTIQSILLGAKSMKESKGESQMGGPGGFPDGRYVMVGGDLKTAALVGDPLTSVETGVDHWLSKDFFKVENVKSVAVTYTNATNNWKISRDTETAEWKLADAKPDEKLDTAKTGGIPNALSYPSFTDVAVDVKPDAVGLDHPATAVWETFDGLTYTLKAAKKGDDSYYLQVAVTGDFPKEREPGKDEKPEDKARLDKEFKDKLQKKQDKLKAEQGLGKWTYIVTKWTLDSVLKDRKDLLAEKKEEPKTDVPPVPETGEAPKPQP